jgi:ATP-dependent DNA helicase PIF1
VRPESVQHETLFCYLTQYTQRSDRPNPLQDSSRYRLISYFPRYPNDQSHDKYPLFCRMKVLLHHPFDKEVPKCDVDHPFAFTGQLDDPRRSFVTWTAAYNYCVQNHVHEHDYMAEAAPPTPDDDKFEEAFHREEGVEAHFGQLARE